jgi:3',5'-cyclic AMP phosphodiesterase CpdA
MLLAGNHEGDGVNNGVLSRFAACLPSRLGQVGTYAKDYYVDRGPVRFIMISPNITLSGTLRTYRNGTAEQAWLRSTIRAAKAASQWTVVGMHEPCLSLGVHGCASSPELTDALIAEHVDLVLAGHDHDYTRTHQLAGTVAAPRVVDGDATMARGAGTVFAVVGNGGYAPRTITAKTSLYAAASGTNTAGGITIGFAKVVVTSDTLRYTLVRTSGGTLVDGFTITAAR